MAETLHLITERFVMPYKSQLCQVVNPVKYYTDSWYAQPVPLERMFYIAMKKVANGMPQTAAGAPGYAHHFKRA